MKVTLFAFPEKKCMVIGVHFILLYVIKTVRLQSDILNSSSYSLPTSNKYSTNQQNILRYNDKFDYVARSFLQKNSLNNVIRTINIARKMDKTQPLIPKQIKFPCNTKNSRSLIKPISVHQLRPGDIDIIGAVGDSLSVGIGAFSTSLSDVFLEYRGVSLTGGGTGTWREFLTLPNILKEFNPNLFGYSYGELSLSQQRGSQFNVAENAALSEDVLDMTKELVNRIKMDPRVNLQEDWKFITMFIGSNTFCLQLCIDDNVMLIELHKQKVFESLLFIKKNLPRTMVQLIMNVNLELLLKLIDKPLRCQLINLIECPCLMAMQYRHNLLKYIRVMKEFQKVEKEIAENELFKNSEDFTVILQTVTENFTIPLNKFNRTDFTYFSSDCFHFSQKGYARAINAIWNNMLQPFGHKSNEWNDVFEKFVCPTERRPYIATWKNSH
ncbi:phospholipase B1, membrane-associated-like [Daktulosphaira vitifoliae]|uniref:phospholipase B1, membrane-associated-like n=1 Tax=Daktulosphaira vitifoliae TaxID=58002 RepID=UPI0021AAC6AD|nr:phospholipase B1, membrane-associated-like [Daktulosphaira vitifoliae]